MALKRDKFDKLFSELVRERSNYACDYCGRSFRHNTALLHCSHFQGRRSKSTRYHPYNASSHCCSCHRKLGEQPGEHTLWKQAEVGEDVIWHIIRLSKTPKNLKAWQLDEIYKHMKGEMERLLSERANGNTGRIEFTLPEWYESGEY